MRQFHLAGILHLLVYAAGCITSSTNLTRALLAFREPVSMYHSCILLLSVIRTQHSIKNKVGMLAINIGNLLLLCRIVLLIFLLLIVLFIVFLLLIFLVFPLFFLLVFLTIFRDPLYPHLQSSFAPPISTLFFILLPSSSST